MEGLAGAEPDDAEEPRPAAPAFRLGHRPELDGLRGVAVILVVVYHLDQMWPAAGDRTFPGGYLGVDLFLVLSGFLITVLLLGEHGDRGRVDVGDFARRRVLRLVPALVALLAAALVVAVVDNSLFGRSIYDTRDVLSTSAWSLTFAGNWAVVFDHHSLSPLGHLWSIALEAQFYVVWAAAVVLVLRQGWCTERDPDGEPRPVGAAIVGVAIVGTVAVATWRLVSYGTRPTDLAHYVSPLTRLDAPLAGAVAGVSVVRGWTRRLEGRVADVCLVGGLTALVVAAVLAKPYEPALFRGGFTLVAVAAALAVVGAVHGQGRRSARALRSRPLVLAGVCSYSLYLWHLPVFVLVEQETRDLSDPLSTLVGLLVTGALVAASYRWVERPWLRRKARGPSRPDDEFDEVAAA